MVKFDITKLKEICSLKEKQFRRFGKYDKVGRYIYKDNGTKILGVAHLDSVATYTHCEHLKLPHRELIFSPTLDDRLGAFLLLDHLPKLGIKFDILLTTDEEIGRSTADNFETTKKYNWIFQFDRAGNDVVMYDYETPELKKTLTKLGWKVGSGSFTDISSLEHLGCKGFNFGVCYDNYHSYDAYASLSDLYKNVDKFKTFYNKFKDAHLPHTQTKYYNFPSKYTKGYPEDDYVDDPYDSWITTNKYKHDIWNYTCSACLKPTSCDLDNPHHIDAYDAAEEGLCVPCYHKYIQDVYDPGYNTMH